MPGISVFLETNYSRTRELGIMERRRFIAGAALAASVPLAVACSRTDSATAAEFQLLPVSDKRVGDFMKYYSEFWTDPAKAVKDYTSPGVVYTSTSGQHFNQAALTSRLTDWAEGFTRVKSEPVFAAGLDNDQILLVIRDTSVHSGQFRGNDPTNKSLEDDAIFTVTYDGSGKILRYTQFADYGGISDTVGADNMSQLHALNGEKQWWNGEVQPTLELPKELIQALSDGISWSEYLRDLYKLADSTIELPDIGVLNTIDESGFPVGMPIHYEFKNDLFYFVSNASAQRNKNMVKNSNVSLLIYYKALNQSTILIKGKAKATPVNYEFSGADKSQTQVLHQIEPYEVGISYLDDLSRVKQEVKRNLYTYTKNDGTWLQSSRRVISIQNDLEDVVDRMVAQDRAWLAPILP